MELSTTVTAGTAAQTTKEATAARELVANGALEIKLNGEELDVTCPTGKKWLVTVQVHIVETNA